MRVYLASPNSQQQAEHASDYPVLLSFAICSRWMERGYAASFDRLLLDSGAYSELTGTAKVDIGAYFDWANRFKHVDAIAGLDDISGDWRRSMKNYKVGGFPTIHDTDPEDLLPELISIAREQGKNWIGIGVKPNPTRSGKEDWLRRTLERIPDDLHIHGWALRMYSHLPFDSFDSTEWWRSAMRIRRDLGDWITYGEAIELSIKRIMRTARIPEQENEIQKKLPL